MPGTVLGPKVAALSKTDSLPATTKPEKRRGSMLTEAVISDGDAACEEYQMQM